MHARVLLVLALVCALGAASAHVYEHPLRELARKLKTAEVEVRTLPAIQLWTNCTKFSHDGQYVNVSWSGVEFPNKEDIVALYVPANVDPAKSVPVQYANAAGVSQTHMTNGSGWAVFRLINMRQDYGFKFIKHGFKQPLVAAAAPRITNAISRRPSQGHLAVHQEESSVVVQWISGSRATQHVQYGTAGHQQYNASVKSAADTYTRDDLCGFPATSVGWLDPGYIHTAVVPLAGLAADTLLYYRYGSEGAGWSEAKAMHVAPRPGVRSDPAVRFLAFNDVAMSNALLFNNVCPPFCPAGLSFADAYGRNSTKLPRYLEKEDAHVALMIGDLSYAIGYAADWDFFGEQFERSFTRWPLAIGLGNHERDWPSTGDAFNNTATDSGGECGVPTIRRYYSPRGHSSSVRSSGTADGSSATLGSGTISTRTSSSSKAAPALFYSFDMGSVHFLVLDSEMPSSPASEQGRFVAADLAALNRSMTPWVVAGMHRMMWAPATWRHPFTGDMDNMERLQRDLEELFVGQVDVVIHGHEHAYARSCMLYKGICVDKAAAAAAAAGSGASATAAGTRHLLMGAKRGRGLGKAIPGRISSRMAQAQTLPARAPVYVLAGHAGAGFTHGFPKTLPDWVQVGYQDRNGYLRFHADYTSLVMEAVSSDDGSIMDRMELSKTAWS